MELYRKLPKIDKLINSKNFENYNKKLLTKIAQNIVDKKRDEIKNNKIDTIDNNEIVSKIEKEYKRVVTPTLKKMINATGIVVHTNLGRSVIDEEIFDSIKEQLSNYNNLEYNEQEGKRGERYSHIRDLAREIFGCEDVLLVNNNASAVFLVLNTFAKQKEVIISRGELVEIGGSFRVPEVMNNSNAILKEVGTTNITKDSDYQNNITENTSMLMKVHKSNYAIEGFTKEVSIDTIATIAKESNITSYYDLGSGYIANLSLDTKDNIKNVLASGVDIVSFSGDKIIGGVQAGIICGSKEHIDKLKKNQLLRMLRVDKVTIAILQKVLLNYLIDEDKIPTIKLLKQPLQTIQTRANAIADKLNIKYSIIKTNGYVGGGAMPNRPIESIAIKIDQKTKPKLLEEHLRECSIIARVEDDRVLLDCRCIFDKDIEYVADSINSYFGA
jgi:L-seryl-tRNA(Ser) seleniumtransferase